MAFMIDCLSLNGFHLSIWYEEKNIAFLSVGLSKQRPTNYLKIPKHTSGYCYRVKTLPFGYPIGAAIH